MRGMGPGLARGGPEGAGAVSTPFTVLAPEQWPTAPPPLLGSLPGPRLLPTHPLAATSHAILPEGLSPTQPDPNPEGRECVCVDVPGVPQCVTIYTHGHVHLSMSVCMSFGICLCLCA